MPFFINSTSRSSNRWNASRLLSAKSNLSSRLAASLSVGGAIALFTTAPATAATYTVTNTNDSGAGSLRDAVAQAEANPGADTIVYDASLAGQTITLTSKDTNIQTLNHQCSGFNGNYTPYGALQITESLTVDGSSAPGITLDGNWNGTSKSTQGNRIFYVPSPNNRPSGSSSTAVVLDLRDITLDNGNAGPLDGGGDFDEPCSNGGNIYFDSNGGELNLTRVNILGGHANDGGGLNVERGNLNIYNSTLSDNLTRDDGGAIDFSGGGTSTIVNSTLAYNIAGFGNAGNTSNRGGAFRLDGVMNMTYVTVAHNTASGEGGFIEVGSSGTLNVRNSLFFNNDSLAEGNNEHCRIRGTLNDLGGNWESVNNASAFPDCTGFNTDTEANIQLSNTLADNGGLTKTLSLDPNSSVNAVIPTSDSLCPEGVGTGDQRYFLRAVGAGCEPGAYELAQANLIHSVSGVAYEEKGSNNTYDSGTDSTLPDGIVVNLYRANDPSTIIATTLTEGGNGSYQFGGLPDDNYLVEIDTSDTDIPANLGLLSSNPRTVTVSGANQTDVDFGFEFSLPGISGSCPISAGNVYRPLDFSNFVGSPTGNPVGRYTNIGVAADGTVLDAIVTLSGNTHDQFGNTDPGPNPDDVRDDIRFRSVKQSSDTELTAIIQFVDPNNGDSPVAINGLFSVFDFDLNKRQEQLVLPVSMVESIALSDPTDMQLSLVDGNYVIGGTDADSGGTDPRNAVEFTFLNKSQISITFRAVIQPGFTDTGNAGFWIDGNLTNASLGAVDCSGVNTFRDYGDAPDSYGTDSADTGGEGIGASHIIDGDLFLGSAPPDADSDGFVDGNDDNGNATDDDATSAPGNGDDEDAIGTFPELTTTTNTYTIPASSITLNNTTGETATLYAFIDFNNNGSFNDPGERISVPVSNNATSPDTDLSFTGFTMAGSAGNTYARFRLSTDAGLTATGAANDGEVEDYQVAIAPPPSLTPANACPTDVRDLVNLTFDVNRQSHDSGPTALQVGHVKRFGEVATVDGQALDLLVEIIAITNNQQNELGRLEARTNGKLISSMAGNDQAFRNDPVGTLRTYELQYTFVAAGTTTPVAVSFEVEFTDIDHIVFNNNQIGSRREFIQIENADLNAFFFSPSSNLEAVSANGGTDVEIFNQNITTFNPDPDVVANAAKMQLVNVSSFNVVYGAEKRKANAAIGDTGFLFDGQDLTLLGKCPRYDYGDAPDTGSGTGTGNYETLLANGGPAHQIINGLHLGSGLPDADNDGTPTVNADGDDQNSSSSSFDDEDGVLLNGSSLQGQTLTAGDTLTLDISTQGNGVLNAWIDWDGDGDFDDTIDGISEQIAIDVAPTADAISLPISVPASVTQGTIYARFRYSSDTRLAPTGIASDGEVEDYQIEIAASTPPGDYGDAPASYGTPGHTNLSNTLYLGRTAPDSETGPELGSDAGAGADGDDNDGTDDDRTFLTQPPTITTSGAYDLNLMRLVNTTGQAATLHAWVDFNQDGQFSATEYQSTTVADGATEASLSWPVPVGMTPGETYVRLRLTSDSLTDDPATSAIDERATGIADGGEVEDYQTNIIELSPVLACSLDNSFAIWNGGRPANGSTSGTSTNLQGVTATWNTTLTSGSFSSNRPVWVESVPSDYLGQARGGGLATTTITYDQPVSGQRFLLFDLLTIERTRVTGYVGGPSGTPVYPSIETIEKGMVVDGVNNNEFLDSDNYVTNTVDQARVYLGFDQPVDTVVFEALGAQDFIGIRQLPCSFDISDGPTT
ncbi:MAG: GEVED domain-containing protein, partial [Cyanobacteria bacterium P01_D01_bin.14]